MKKLALATALLALTTTSAFAAKVSVESFDVEHSGYQLGAESLAGPVEGLTFDMFVAIQDQSDEALWVSADYYNTDLLGFNALGGTFTPYVGLDYGFSQAGGDTWSELELGMDYQIGDWNFDASHRGDFAGDDASILQTSIKYDINATFSVEVEHRQDLLANAQQHLELRAIVNFTESVQGELYRDIETDVTAMKLSYLF